MDLSIYIQEEKAKKKYCVDWCIYPLYRSEGSPGYTIDKMCKGSMCMSWRTSEKDKDYGRCGKILGDRLNF